MKHIYGRSLAMLSVLDANNVFAGRKLKTYLLRDLLAILISAEIATLQPYVCNCSFDFFFSQLFLMFDGFLLLIQ